MLAVSSLSQLQPTAQPPTCLLACCHLRSQHRTPGLPPPTQPRHSSHLITPLGPPPLLLLLLLLLHASLSPRLSQAQSVRLAMSSASLVLALLLALLLALSVADVSAAATAAAPASTCTVTGPTTYPANSGTSWSDQSLASSGTTTCQIWPTGVTMYYDTSLNVVTGIYATYSNGQSAQHGDVSTTGTNKACSSYTFADKSLSSVTVNYDGQQVYQVALGTTSTSDGTYSCGTSNSGASTNTIGSASNGWVGFFAGATGTSTCGGGLTMEAFGAATITPNAVVAKPSA